LKKLIKTGREIFCLECGEDVQELIKRIKITEPDKRIVLLKLKKTQKRLPPNTFGLKPHFQSESYLNSLKKFQEIK